MFPTWKQHLMRTRNELQIPLKEAMQVASGTYRAHKKRYNLTGGMDRRNMTVTPPPPPPSVILPSLMPFVRCLSDVDNQNSSWMDKSTRPAKVTMYTHVRIGSSDKVRRQTQYTSWVPLTKLKTLYGHSFCKNKENWAIYFVPVANVKVPTMTEFEKWNSDTLVM